MQSTLVTLVLNGRARFSFPKSFSIAGALRPQLQGQLKLLSGSERTFSACLFSEQVPGPLGLFRRGSSVTKQL
jgi:hypothetical protein